MSAVIFSGAYVKALKAGLRLKDQATIWSGPNDPTVTPTFGNQGDLYIKFGATPAFYQKTGATGTDTSWTDVSSGGGGTSYTPANPADWVIVPTTVPEALDELASQTYDQNYVVEKITLTPTDITNEFITLATAPITPSKTRLVIIGGPEQDYGVDYSVSGAQLTWNGLGLDSVLTSGEKLIVTYSK